MAETTRDEDLEATANGRASRVRRRRTFSWISWPAIGTVGGAAAAALLTLAADQLTLSTPRAEAAGDYGDALGAGYETFGERADAFKTSALAAADAMLLGRSPWEARVDYRRFQGDWGDYQRIYKDIWLATEAARRKEVLAGDQAILIKGRLELATNASLRAYRCVYAATETYGSGSPQAVLQQATPERVLRCADTGNRYFELDAELDQIDSCNSALRTAMVDLTAAMRVERVDSPLTVVKRRIGWGGDRGAGALSHQWDGIEAALKRDCSGGLQSARKTRLGALYPWLQTAPFVAVDGQVNQDGLIADLAPATTVAPGATVAAPPMPSVNAPVARPLLGN